MQLILLTAICPILLALSFPQFDYGFLAWIALVPLMVAIRRKSLAVAFGLSYCAGIGFFMGIFYWINVVPGFGYRDFLVLGLYLGAYWGIFGLVSNFMEQKHGLSIVAMAPVLWVSLEYLRSHADFLGLPWGLIGHSQYHYLPVIQIAAFTGVFGISFLVVMVNAVLSELLVDFRSRMAGGFSQNHYRLYPYVLLALLALGLSLTYGKWTLLHPLVGGEINLSIIQGNIPQASKWDLKYRQANLDKHIRLTQKATQAGNPSLIIWPEASVQGAFTSDLQSLSAISALARDTKTYLLVGGAHRPKIGGKVASENQQFNSAFLISPEGGIVEEYQKIHLLPFAEYLPYQGYFPWPRRMSSQIGSFTAGSKYTVFNLAGVPFGVAICWENIFPDLFRQFVQAGAAFMVNITNEAWFGQTAAPYQFVAISVMRAVENRISIARSANTGISCFIDPRGQILEKVHDSDKVIFVEGYLTEKIPLARQTTFYTRHGDIFAYMNLMLAFLLVVTGVTKKNKFSC